MNILTRFLILVGITVAVAVGVEFAEAGIRRRKIPQNHKHKTISRCLDHGKWIKGCK